MARATVTREAMLRDLAGGISFSELQAKYLFPCNDIVERPDKRFAYWLTEKAKLSDP